MELLLGIQSISDCIESKSLKQLIWQLTGEPCVYEIFLSNMPNMNDFYIMSKAVLPLSKRCSKTTAQDKDWFNKYLFFKYPLAHNLWKDI